MAHYAGETTVPGYVDGAGDQARFSTPRGLDIDSSGNLFMADYSNGAIRSVGELGKLARAPNAAKANAGNDFGPG